MIKPERDAVLSLSELVELTGVPASTIHHYLRAGLIPPPGRAALNRFGYDHRHVETIRVIRVLRERRGLRLEDIAAILPDLVARGGCDTDAGLSELGGQEPEDARERVVGAAVRAFQTRSFGEVTVADVADAAGVGKGSVYRHFASKEDLFTACMERVLADTATRFAEAVSALGGPEGLAGQPETAAVTFAGLVADALPLLLEVGTRAAKGHDASEALARRALRTLAAAAGQPLTAAGGQEAGQGSSAPEADPAIVAGLAVIGSAFATVLRWAVGPGWPPEDLPDLPDLEGT